MLLHIEPVNFLPQLSKTEFHVQSLNQFLNYSCPSSYIIQNSRNLLKDIPEIGGRQAPNARHTLFVYLPSAYAQNINP